MLDEMPVTDVSLNELSRRVGLAKSNVLRYFDSREGVILELLDAFLEDWLAEVTGALDDNVDERRSATQQAERLAAILARTLAERRVLCDLVGAQGAVLEHNISVDVVVRHQRIALTMLATAGDLLRRHLPGVGKDAERLLFHILVIAGALAPTARHRPACGPPTSANPPSPCSTSTYRTPCSRRSGPCFWEHCHAPETQAGASPRRRSARSRFRSGAVGYFMRPARRCRLGDC